MSHQTKLPFKKNGGAGNSDSSADKVVSQRRNRLKDIADSTLQAIEAGSVSFADIKHDVAAKVRFSNHNTRYYAPDDILLSAWASNAPKLCAPSTPEISILEVSTLDGARLLYDTLSSRTTTYGRIALLNFASATRPGGGFLGGAQAQEESIARSSTLYPSLMTNVAQQFYELHGRDRKGGFYYDAMIYTPSVVVIRNDAGDWVSPFEVDVLTSAAVNAGDVRAKNAKGAQVNSAEIERRIEVAMRERMGKILCLLEQQGAKNIILGSFGTGVFRNSVEVVAKIWADLLTGHGARFRRSFDRIVFAILGKDTFSTFKQTFENPSNRMDVDR
ncbi:hypothetical protein HYDPIDRAFT_130107 [Hydnomerulius pinastri MD-312]|nr:hypothetical protein HYDPIDRAFT_130107 [Hydnomerulius pinastri MD-312]